MYARMFDNTQNEGIEKKSILCKWNEFLQSFSVLKCDKIIVFMKKC